MKPLYMQDFKRQDHVSIVGEMHEMRTSRGNDTMVTVCAALRQDREDQGRHASRYHVGRDGPETRWRFTDTGRGVTSRGA